MSSTHLGMGFDPDVRTVVADRLARPSAGAAPAVPSTTGLTSSPMPGMRHSATSPARTWMAPGVPVEMTSPG